MGHPVLLGIFENVLLGRYYLTVKHTRFENVLLDRYYTPDLRTARLQVVSADNVY